MRFEELAIHPQTLRALEAMGFEEATPIQEQTIPGLLAGSDLIAQAQTGTGKTAAFGIPLVESARQGKRGLVLTPTRELAKQVQRELQAIAHGSEVDVVCLIGGASFGDQVRALQRHPGAILVATPGRVVDHLGRGTIDLAAMSILVLDEADEMLSMGFQDEVDAIVAAIPDERQTMLFTATLPKSIEALARKALRDPKTVRTGAGKGGAAKSVRQCYATVAGRDRPDAIRRIVEAEAPRAALLFANTRARVDELAQALAPVGAEALHGGMGQPMRDAVMQRLRDGRTKILVATDVAARGLDVQEVELVLHDGPATDVETYIHRIGRTGRAGRSGLSILLMTPGKLHQMASVQRTVGDLTRYVVPDAGALADLRLVRIVEELQELEPHAAARQALAKAKEAGLAAEDVALRALSLLAAPKEEVAIEAPATVGLALKVGSMDNVHPGAIVGVLTNAGGLRASDIGRIDILPRMSVAEVPTTEVERLVQALGRVTLSGRKLLPRPAEDWRFKAPQR